MDDDSQKVTVVNTKNEFLSYTHPARARKLLKQGKAEVFSNDPFIIKIRGGRGAIMQPRQLGPMVNFTEFFREERDIYVQNTSGGMQISITFEVAPGRVEHVTIPPTKKPFNLTQFVPFNAIKNSTDIRRFITRHPPRLRLMTEEEYNEFFVSLAKRRGTSMDQEITQALEEQAMLMDRRVPVDATPPKKIDELREEIESNPELAGSDQVHPRVAGICAEVGPEVEEKDRPKAGKILDDLEAIEDQLKEGDLEYLMSKGGYPTVKKWAKQRLDEVLMASDEE